MIALRQPDQITIWHLAFWPDAPYRLARFVPGHFKHVAAFGWSAACRTWVIYDVRLTDTIVMVLPDGSASIETIAAWTRGASILKIAARRRPPPWVRFGFWCVPAMKHLVGLRSGAVLPDQLWRSCRRHGAEILIDGLEPATASHGRRATA